MSQKFNSGNVPYGSRAVALKKADGSACSPTTWVLENFNPTRPGRVINRPNQLGAPNGWVLDEDQETATAVIQIPTHGATDYPALGFYFDENWGYGGAATGTKERWVITNIGQAFDMGGYYKANINLQLDRSGTGANTAFS